MSKDGTSRCASCGIAENDEVKLKKCNGCFLVKYCGVKCQKEHRKQHKQECKARAAELRDELLFKQPEETHLGDCPICCLPLSLDMANSGMHFCCSKLICHGCNYANQMRELKQRLQPSCSFCREPVPATKEEAEKQRMKRVEANDPIALSHEGGEQHKKGDYTRAFEYFTKAAELGDVWAHYQLSLMYHDGLGVEIDEGKEIHHLEEAAIGGHPEARYMLGSVEGRKGNIERAMKHWIIAATQGYGVSMKELMRAFKSGFVGKEDLAATLRAHKAAVDATKSPQREAVEKSLPNSRK